MSDGWYVRKLLSNRFNIYTNITEILDTSFDSDSCEEEDIAIFVDLEDDIYNDLLIVEKELENLKRSGRIGKKEWKILDMLIFNPQRMPVIESELHITRGTLITIYRNICAKVAFSLGSYFTNEGYINYFSKKYDLNEEQEENLRSILEK